MIILIGSKKVNFLAECFTKNIILVCYLYLKNYLESSKLVIENNEQAGRS